jgi:hypothetical protein
MSSAEQKTAIHTVPDLADEFAFSWTALAFNDNRIGTFQGVSNKDVDNLPHQHTSPISDTAQSEGRSFRRLRVARSIDSVNS